MVRVPVISFRPASDSHYTKMCDGYNEMVHSPNAAQGTQHIRHFSESFLKRRRFGQLGSDMDVYADGRDSFHFRRFRV